jgi:ATP-dependent helicase HrpA
VAPRPDELAEARRAARPITSYPESLPITNHREELVAAIASHQVVIVAGETGSGKSTQLPKLCLDAGRGLTGMIGHTQPRRVAARTIAERVADELGCPVGGAVGYAVRFTDTVSASTSIKVMTDGILLAEIQRDPDLSAYDTIIVDEAHERSLNIDFLLGYLTVLLARRADLHVVVTSATLDTAAFSAHFGGAPVIEVAGRSYPVEVRYRPYGVDPDDDRDQVGAIADAVAELAGEGDGDVLVFCSGEREIHDAADFLRRAELAHTEILPLYARLSSAEQHRVFQPHTGRRVILATNVAETSITVPGVRYVVDTGTARISRYSRRLKVQRLPIEAISQASAAQRAGRCGRVGPGVAIRLYSEQDLAERAAFTEPEILRTNLASVILQMSALGLGEVASFPFLAPPDPRAVADGVALLEELGALVPQAPGRAARLTRLGRRLARLPIDPRLGRMVLEAERLGCVREVMVIAAALSIQDPRERPAEATEAAAAAHRRFVGEDASDFAALVRLWDHLRTRQRELSGNQFRRACRQEFLNYLRVREWQDLFSQLRQVVSSLGLRVNTEPAHPDHVHQAVLAGLLSHIGMREGDRNQFRGARGARFVVGRPSAQAARPARWVMAAELVETDRLWARTVARIQPEWAERVGAHLCKYSYGEPTWDPVAGAATVPERVTLYGLPIVDKRRVLLRRVDPAAAHRFLVRHELTLAEPDAYDFVAHNAEVVAEVRSLAERMRRFDLVPDDDDLDAFYRSRVPAEVTSRREFQRWWDRTRRDHPALLSLTRDDLIGENSDALEDFPATWTAHEPALELTYGAQAGDDDDGVTVHLPLVTLNQLDPAPFTWLVPGLRRELVAAYLKTLPKALRRELSPAGEHVAAAVAALADDPGPQGTRTLAGALAAQFTRQGSVVIREGDFDPSALPAHLQVRFSIDDAHGQPVATGRDLVALQRQCRSRVRAEIAAALGGVERVGVTDWDFGDWVPVLQTHVQGHVVRGYPALVDDGTAVQLRILTSTAAAQRATSKGIRRLVAHQMALPRQACARLLTNQVRLSLAQSGWATAVDFVDDIVAATLTDCVERAGPTPVDRAGFVALVERVRSELEPTATAATRTAMAVVVAAGARRGALALHRAPSAAPAVADATAQLDALVHPGFVSETGLAQLVHLPRYLEALAYRMDRWRERPGRDAEAMARVQRLQARHGAVLASPEGRHARWLIEELRVSVFAQHLGTAVPVSEHRVDAELARLAERDGVG